MARNAHGIRPLVTVPDKVEAGPASLRIAQSGQAGFDPVGRLRLNVSRAFGSAGQGRWSPLSTSIFLLTVCGTFWFLVALALLNSHL